MATAPTLSDERQMAFFGMLQARNAIAREIDQELMAAHGLSISTYEILNRIDRSETGRLRITDLAEQTWLSLSRVSRLADDLVARGIAERLQCPGDRRASHLALTDAGRELVGQAQVTFYATVERCFLGKLSDEEIAVLAAVFDRIASGGSSCKVALGAEE